MKIFNYKTVVLVFNLVFITACSTTQPTSSIEDLNDKSETLYVYEDGRMQYKSRFLNEDDVVIYDDGRGGEKAAIKVRVPIHSDFYRDSIIVVRVTDRFNEAISQNETEGTDGVN